MKRILITISAVFLIFNFLFLGLFLYSRYSQPKANVLPVYKTVALDSNKLFDLIQKYRFDNNFSSFKNSDFLCEIAEQRLDEVHKDWSHEKFNANRFCQSCTLGENLAKGHLSEEATYKDWLNSPTHKYNLDSTFTHSCLKCSKENYCVQIFGYY